eukprot:gene24294-biopygen13436
MLDRSVTWADPITPHVRPGRHLADPITPHARPGRDFARRCARCVRNVCKMCDMCAKRKHAITLHAFALRGEPSNPRLNVARVSGRLRYF